LDFDVDSTQHVDGLNTNNKKECNTVLVPMYEDKTEGRDKVTKKSGRATATGVTGIIYIR
jgi:hypothetical protein